MRGPAIPGKVGYQLAFPGIGVDGVNLLIKPGMSAILANAIVHARLRTCIL
jgi:hypothetical protein